MSRRDLKLEKRLRRRKRRRFRLTLLLVLLLAGAAADSNLRPETDEYVVELARLPAAFDGLRVLQLSDLHGIRLGKGNSRLLQAARDTRPDLIVLTGDFIDFQEDLSVCATLLPALSRIAPCYFVSGNHDWGCGYIRELTELLDMSGVTYLRNEYLTLSRNGEELVLCGVEDPNSWAEMIRPDELVRQARAAFPDRCLLLLAHRNYWPDAYPDIDADLIFCGHGHGGILRLGPVGLLGTDRTLLPKYTSGVYPFGQSLMVVSRGLGNTPGTLRLCNNPELVVVTLKKG